MKKRYSAILTTIILFFTVITGHAKPATLALQSIDVKKNKPKAYFKKNCRRSLSKAGLFAVVCDVTITTSQTANFTITNNSGNVIARNIRAQIPDNWTDVTQDASACQELMPGKSCVLSIQAGGFARSRRQFAIVGDNTESLLINFTINASQYAYVASPASNNITSCAVQPDGTLDLCSIAASGFNTPNDVFFNPANSFAYVTNSFAGSTAISKCVVNTDGTFGSCTAAGNLPFPIVPNRGAINPGGTSAFISQSIVGGGDFYDCPIIGSGDFGICNAVRNGTRPEGITFKNASVTYAVFRGDNQVDICNGDLTVCGGTTLGGTAAMNTVTVNAAESRAYIALSTGVVLGCEINGVNAFFNCFTTFFPGGGHDMTSVAINQAQDRAFVADAGNNAVWSCEFTNSDRELTNCSTTGQLFSSPNSIRIVNF